MEIITTILASTVVSAIVTGIIGVYTSNRKKKLRYITEEREKWRESIRSIACELSEFNSGSKKKLKLAPILTKLKTRINAYGVNDKEGVSKSEYYLKDSHIWEQIKKTQLIKDMNKKEIHSEVDDLIMYLSILLKYDWERSKKEVKGNKDIVIGQTIFLVTIMASIIMNSIYFKGMYNILTFLAPLVLTVVPRAVKMKREQLFSNSGQGEKWRSIQNNIVYFFIIILMYFFLVALPLSQCLFGNTLDAKLDFNLFLLLHACTQFVCIMMMVFGCVFIENEEIEENEFKEEYVKILIKYDSTKLNLKNENYISCNK